MQLRRLSFIISLITPFYHMREGFFMSLDDSVRSLFSRTAPQQRWAFLSCALAGYLTH